MPCCAACREAGPRAEGEGYWMVAEAHGWYGHRGVRERTFTEDHARDSFENMLFGLCRFYELTGGAGQVGQWVRLMLCRCPAD